MDEEHHCHHSDVSCDEDATHKSDAGAALRAATEAGDRAMLEDAMDRHLQASATTATINTDY
jgi:hypothetical protein